ncbi:PREDICTED: uncharacterized protein LOC107065563 [Polistes dominula]|uniref:Uncharacterized protein LOC107065563 n=1 Tax=Polistes dominula TaxID=743375 RepID=A0ABM1I3V2_POLDO|nr:PREDICTED: uncharacterized protein LOC107065563 [Polistes dominula]
MARCFEIIAMLKNNGNFYETIFLARWSMKLLGLWPEKDLYASIKSFLIFLMFSIMFIPSFLYIKKGESIPVDIILMMVYSVPTITRFLFAKLNSKSYKIIIKRMIDDWNDFSDLSETNKKILLHHAKIARRINIIHTLCIVLTYFSKKKKCIVQFFFKLSPLIIKIIYYLVFILTPIYNGHIVNINSYLNVTIRKLPFEGWFPFDEKQTPVFEIIYMIQLMQNFFIMCVNFSTDSFLCTAVLHACGQLAILSNVIRNTVALGIDGYLLIIVSYGKND